MFRKVKSRLEGDILSNTGIKSMAGIITVGAVLILIGIFLVFSSFLDFGNSVSSVDCSNWVSGDDWQNDCDYEGDFGEGACIGGVVFLLIGIGLMTFSWLPVILGKNDSGDKDRASECGKHRVPSLRSRDRIACRCLGKFLFECPSCEGEFEWGSPPYPND